MKRSRCQVILFFPRIPPRVNNTMRNNYRRGEGRKSATQKAGKWRGVKNEGGRLIQDLFSSPSHFSLLPFSRKFYNCCFCSGPYPPFFAEVKSRPDRPPPALYMHSLKPTARFFSHTARACNSPLLRTFLKPPYSLFFLPSGHNASAVPYSGAIVNVCLDSGPVLFFRRPTANITLPFRARPTRQIIARHYTHARTHRCSPGKKAREISIA